MSTVCDTHLCPYIHDAVGRQQFHFDKSKGADEFTSLLCADIPNATGIHLTAFAENWQDFSNYRALSGWP